MNLREKFKSNENLAAEDLEENGWTVTIRDVMLKKFDEGEKIALALAETEKVLVLNVTNRNTIAGLYGYETDDWIGRKIHLYPTEVLYDKKMVPCIRIRNRVPGAKPKPNGAAKEPLRDKPKPMPADEFDEFADGDSISD